MNPAVTDQMSIMNAFTHPLGSKAQMSLCFHSLQPRLTPPLSDNSPVGYLPGCLEKDPFNVSYQPCDPALLTPPLYAEPRVKVAVIGTGYVGLHLVEAFATAYEVIAYDINPARIQEVAALVRGKPVEATCDPQRLSTATHFLIAVSTLLTVSRSIDTSYIESALATVQRYALPGSTIVIESSVAVGMTRQLLGDLCKSQGFKCGMSPERVDPGRTHPHYSTIPKIVSGLDETSADEIHKLYSRVFFNIVRVSKPEVAEMTKLYENCQRMVCIAFANEMADACKQFSANDPSGKLGQKDSVLIDPWEVAQAASTKPFGYMPYSPSLGVGGHCIPVNPYYLMSNCSFPLLQACTESMADRPRRVAADLMASLRARMPRQKRHMPRRQRILVVGMGFKRGQSVLSNSPGRALATHLLEDYNTHVEFADPLVTAEAVPAIPRFDHERDWDARHIASEFDAVVVAVEQPGLDMSVIDAVEKKNCLVLRFCR